MAAETQFGIGITIPIVEGMIAGYPWPHITDAWARRKNCLLGWLTASKLVTDPTVKEFVETCLRKEVDR